MKIQFRRFVPAFTLTTLTLAAMLVQPMLRAEPDELSQPEYHKLADWRYEALHGDRTHLAEMIAALHNPHRAYVVTALQAVTQLNAAEALPDIEVVAQTYPVGSYLHSRAKVIIARLEAGDNVPAPTSPVPLRAAKQTLMPSRVQAKAANLLTHLGLTPQQVGAGAASFVQNKARLERQSAIGYVETPQEIVAMQEMADILYREAGMTADARKAFPKAFPNLDFTLDFPSDLKIKLAPLSHKERIAWLVNDLAQTQTETVNTSYEVQLAIDEGIDSSNAAAAKLKQMDLQRAKYTDQGFIALFNVLDGVGDKAQIPLVKHFIADKDSYLRNSVGAHGGVAGGQKYQYIPGY